MKTYQKLKKYRRILTFSNCSVMKCSICCDLEFTTRWDTLLEESDSVPD